jgi:ribonuclease HI
MPIVHDLKIFCDGGARGNPGPAASAFVVVDPSGRLLFKKGIYIGKATNNQAEYRAVLGAVEWLAAEKYSGTGVTFYLDSLLVASQLSGKYKVKDASLLIIYRQIFQTINENRIPVKSYIHIPRALNSQADTVVNETLDALV